jgi:hypothetical protein
VALTTPLRTPEAVTLAHAVVAEVAAAREIRVLFIKGPSAAWWGLREPRVSADVDVLVEPARLTELVDALADVGWHERQMPAVPRIVPLHSATLINASWSCDLDVHSCFPGIFAAATEAFDRMWESRAQMPIAGVTVPVPSRAMSACILALHDLRHPTSTRAVRELPRLVERVRDVLGADAVDEIAQAARLLRARTPLAPFLADIGVDVVEPDLSDVEERLWDQMVAERTSPSIAWLHALRRAPWHRRPAVLWAALTFVNPTDQDHGDPYTYRRLRYRVARLGRGVRGVGRVARQVRT